MVYGVFLGVEEVVVIKVVMNWFIDEIFVILLEVKDFFGEVVG